MTNFERTNKIYEKFRHLKLSLSATWPFSFRLLQQVTTISGRDACTNLPCLHFHSSTGSSRPDWAWPTFPWCGSTLLPRGSVTFYTLILLNFLLFYPQNFQVEMFVTGAARRAGILWDWILLRLRLCYFRSMPELSCQCQGLSSKHLKGHSAPRVCHVTFLLKGHSGTSVCHVTFLLKGHSRPSVCHVTFLLKGHSGPSVCHVTFLLKGHSGPS